MVLIMFVYYPLIDKPLKPYTTAQEKDILLTIEDNAPGDKLFKDILDMLGVDTSNLSPVEIKAVLYKLREISVGESIEVTLTCPHCHTPMSVDVPITNILRQRTLEHPEIKDLHRLPKDETDFLTNFVTNDEMPLQTYEYLYQHVSETQTLLDFNSKCKCLACKQEILVNLDRPKFIAKMLSEDSLISLYKTYDALIFHGHWAKSDIDNLLPFERGIFLNLLQEALEKRAKGNANRI